MSVSGNVANEVPFRFLLKKILVVYSEVVLKDIKFSRNLIVKKFFHLKR